MSLVTPSRLVLAAFVMGGALVLDAGAAAAQAADPVQVTITDKGCEPMALNVLEGKTTFKIRNQSKRALEWEILNGVIVVEERENILPNFVQSLSATLEPGEYQMTCGLLSNPKGTLTVAAINTAATSKAKPSAMDLVGPLAEYKLYVTQEVDALVEGTRKFTDAVKAKKIDEAKALYAPTRQHYERIEPIAELFNDLDKSIDVRADDFEKKEADPNFTGFHRLEKALFADGKVDDMGPFADKLLADVSELKSRIAKLTFPPAKVVGGAAGLIEEVAATKLSGEEDRYSRTDLWDFQANVDGAKKIFDLFRPAVDRRKPEVVKRVEANFVKVDAVLAKYKDGAGFVSYDKVTDKDRKALKGPVTTLAEDLSTFRGTLGLN